MSRVFLQLIIVFTAAVLQAALKPVDSAFKKMTSPKGEWEGKDAEGNPVPALSNL